VEFLDQRGRGQITSVAYVPNHRIVLVASVRAIYAHRDDRNDCKETVVDLVKGEDINAQRIQSFYFDPDSNCFLVTVPPTPTTGMKLLLYRLEFGSKIIAIKIREHVNSSTKLTLLTMNTFWTAPTGHIVCAFYDESRKVSRIFNWGKLDDPESLSIKPNNERTLKLEKDDDPVVQFSHMLRDAQPSPASPNGMQSTLMILTRSQLHIYGILYDKA